MTNFPDTPRMDSMGAGVNVNSASELAQVWGDMLRPSARKRALKDCSAYFATLGGAAERTWSEIKLGILDRKGRESV